ncbi:MAG TPA: phosphodiester glycosidase family protein [Gemmatimonadales bacterium]|nr:phosphodiester glycosidase family protein [Gemmatimonadales bacterium]
MRAIVSAALVAVAAAALAGGVMGSAGAANDAGRPGDALAVREGERWVTWWRRNAAPVRYDGTSPLAERIVWRPGASGIEWGELQLRGASEAWRTRLVVVRVDPRRVALSLDAAFLGERSWTIRDAGEDAVLALDAGQFRQSLPWGWVVSGGREVLRPQYAPLAGAVVVDAAGGVRIVAPDSVAVERARGTAREAFQSYPMLLENGVVPTPLRSGGRGVDLAHRDARLALCTAAGGRILIGLTRFDVLGETMGRVPFGLTTPEMAAVMGGLGCRHALLLDGGISGQMLVRGADGPARTWPGTRGVPLGVVGRPRR